MIRMSRAPLWLRGWAAPVIKDRKNLYFFAYQLKKPAIFAINRRNSRFIND
jgi:hypothetical protein